MDLRACCRPWLRHELPQAGSPEAFKSKRIVLNHKDRLFRFGAELVFAICEVKNVEIVILNQGEDTSFEQDLAQDVLEIIRLFGGSMAHARRKTTI
jgi:predicted site-specific integrase-resolvase